MMQKLVQTSLANTAWSDTLVPMTKMKIDDGKTTAVQAFVRVPRTKADQMLKLSGMNEDFIFLREFVDKQVQQQTHKFTNLWLQKVKFKEAKIKCAVIDNSKSFGLIWNKTGYGIRVKQEDASSLAPILTGRSYVVGDRYWLSGIPRDCSPESLFKALSEADQAWDQIMTAHRITQKWFHGSMHWLVKSAVPPPTNLYFLDELVITVEKEQEKAKPEAVKKMVVTASAWNRAAVCPSKEMQQEAEEPKRKVARMQQEEQRNQQREPASSQPPVTQPAVTQEIAAAHAAAMNSGAIPGSSTHVDEMANMRACHESMKAEIHELKNMIQALVNRISPQ